MRRSFSLLSAALVATSSLVALSPGVSVAQAPGDIIVTRSATVGPASVPDAQILASTRLNRTNQILVVGRDSVTAGSQLNIWRINDDLSIDSTFAAVALGTISANPTAADSNCAASNDRNCQYIESIVVNEIADRYALNFSTNRNGSGASSQRDLYIHTLIVGRLSTGEVLSTVSFSTSYLIGIDLNDWSQYNVTDLPRTMCTSGAPATVNGIALSHAYLRLWNVTLRPDGSVIGMIDCEYNNHNGGSYPSSVVESSVVLLVGLRPAAGAIEVDPTFGTNGYVTLFNDPTKCGIANNSRGSNTAITSNTSTDPFMIQSVQLSSRRTTIPSYMSSQNVTSYDGCQTSGSQNVTYEGTMSVIQADGTVKASFVPLANKSLYVNRWFIDTEGRWNGLTYLPSDSPTPSGPEYGFIRLNPQGELDTTFGTNGIERLGNMDAKLTYANRQFSLWFDLTGVAFTSEATLYSGIQEARSASAMCMNDQTQSDQSRAYFPYFVSQETGFVNNYGTNGFGTALEVIRPQGSSCSDGDYRALTFVDSKGRPSIFLQVSAATNQTAGLLLASWVPADGVIGGGEGDGGVGAADAGRTDTKVYARKLPTRTEVHTSLNVLTKKTSRTQMLRTRTPKVCVNLTRSLVMVKAGTCRVDVVDKSTNRVVRRLSTRVRTTEATVGTTVNAQDSIRFKQVSTRLSRSAKSQIAELAETAAEAKRVILVGHTAVLTENTISNNRIALQRAARVKAELRKQFKAAGVKVPISIVSVGPRAPLTTKLSASAQARNRRVEIYVMP